MYNPYYNNQFYTQQYENDLQNIMREAQSKLNQLHTQSTQQPQPQQQVPITQNFQLSPSQNNNGIKYANDIDDVKKELVFADTLFINKEHTKLWLKNTLGEVKTFELIEIIEKDEKDRQIDELMAKIKMLESELRNNEPANDDNANDDATITNKKPSSISRNKSSNK